jgi:hypothetical protein
MEVEIVIAPILAELGEYDRVANLNSYFVNGMTGLAHAALLFLRVLNEPRRHSLKQIDK